MTAANNSSALHPLSKKTSTPAASASLLYARCIVSITTLMVGQRSLMISRRFDPIEQRHLRVHENDIRLNCFDYRKRLLSVSSLEYLERPLEADYCFQQRFHPRPRRCIVIDDEQAERFSLFLLVLLSHCSHRILCDTGIIGTPPVFVIRRKANLSINKKDRFSAVPLRNLCTGLQHLLEGESPAFAYESPKDAYPSRNA